jgi:ariadne-1
MCTGSAPSDDEDMDMDAFNDDFKVASKDKRKLYEIEYQSLSQPEVEKLMQQDVDHIIGIFGVDVCTTISSPTLFATH